MYVCMYACMYACMYVCMYACMYVCMYGCYVCTSIHTYVPCMVSMLCYHYCCCRRNNTGDKDKALGVMEELLKQQENQVPDFLCLCGRIYKDKFVESNYTDNESRDRAIHW